MSLTKDRIRFQAFRDFAGGLLGVSAFAAIGLYALVYSSTSPFPDKTARAVVLVIIAAAWLVATVSLLRSLRRDLTPVVFAAAGLLARNRAIAFGQIAFVDPMEGKGIFLVRLHSGRRVFFSKVGFDTEETFLNELKARRLVLAGPAKRDSFEGDRGRG